MVVVEPVVNQEKVRQLLGEQAESDRLDYKEVVDLRVTRDEVELAKDIGAMQLLGGFVVVGADSRGRLTGRFTADQASQFDEANVRQKLAKYIPEPIELLAAAHTIDGIPVAIVYTGQHRDCLAIFRRNGQYRTDDGRDDLAFRQGEVFARHGSRSERWRQEDMDAIRRCLVAKEKEAWRRDLAEDLERIQTGAGAQRLIAGPAQSMTWRLDGETFRSATVELLRLNDAIPLRLLLQRIPVDARALLEAANSDAEFDSLVDRTADLAAVAQSVEASWLFDDGVEALRRVYLLGHGDRLGIQLTIAPERIWLTILLRVYALGGLAVRREDWRSVGSLATQEPEPADGRSPFYRSWIRHGLTMAARSRLLMGEREGRQIELSLISMAQEVVRNESGFRPDAPEADEMILNSLCQFDALASLAAIAKARSTSTSNFYTSFARFYSYRTEPAIVRLIGEAEMRDAIFPLTDQELADALRTVNRLAQSEAFRYAGWDGFSDNRILAFLAVHPPAEGGNVSG